jgi:hypothetical protein
MDVHGTKLVTLFTIPTGVERSRFCLQLIPGVRHHDHARVLHPLYCPPVGTSWIPSHQRFTQTYQSLPPINRRPHQ